MSLTKHATPTLRTRDTPWGDIFELSWPERMREIFRYGTLARSFRMPDGSAEDDVRATYKGGILEVRVAMPEKPLAKAQHKIQIARG